MFKLDFEKAEEPEIKLPISVGSQKKQENSRKTSTSASLSTPKPWTVWITTTWKILQDMGIPDHLPCLLRNLYAGQEATVRTEHGTTDWFQIGKGIHKGCALSPCLFNLYAEYIMQNARLDEAQAGIKIAGSHLCLLWRSVCLGHFPTFWLGCLIFWHWVVWDACIFWKLILCQLLKRCSLLEKWKLNYNEISPLSGQNGQHQNVYKQ